MTVSLLLVDIQGGRVVRPKQSRLTPLRKLPARYISVICYARGSE